VNVVDGFVHVLSTFTATFVPALAPSQPYTIGVRAENISGEGAMATVSGTTPSS